MPYGLSVYGTDLYGQRTIEAFSSNYTTTGSDVGLASGFIFEVQSGSYSLTGNSRYLHWTRAVAADSNSYSSSGFESILTRHLGVFPDTGNYTLSGKLIDLQKTFVLKTDGTTYTYLTFPVILDEIAKPSFGNSSGVNNNSNNPYTTNTSLSFLPLYNSTSSSSVSPPYLNSE